MFSLVRNCINFSMAAAMIGMPGCRAKEAAPSNFIQNPEMMSRDDTTPFQRTYWNRKYNSKMYDELIVATVDTHYIMAQNFWEKASVANVSHEKIQNDVDALAEYTRQSFIKSGEQDPKHRFKIVQTAGAKT